jgi:hypothetical protein
MSVDPWLGGLKGLFGRDYACLRSGGLGSMALAGLRSRAGGLEIPQHSEQQLCGPIGQGLVCSACYSFSISWPGEASQELGVQSADVSALPQSSVLYLSQVCLQPLCKVPGSQRSEGLWLCPGHHLVFSPVHVFTFKHICKKF